MTPTGGPGRISRKELLARASVGMPLLHPELVMRKPTRGEWKHLAEWMTEMWPYDEYIVIVAEELRKQRPPGTRGWRWAP